MALTTSMVIGGCGFIGSYIVRALVERGEDERIVVFDLTAKCEDEDEIDDDSKTATVVEYVKGDVRDAERVDEIIKEFKPTCIYHTASPKRSLPTTPSKSSIFHDVNVTGTSHIIQSSITHGVQQLVYTSSAAVVYEGKDLKGVDETYHEGRRSRSESLSLSRRRGEGVRRKKGKDMYLDSKLEAERLVLDANGKGELKTVVLRVAPTFGPGDVGFMKGLDNLGKSSSGRRVQLGDNSNLLDWVYVSNVASAHLLASSKLSLSPPSSSPVAGNRFIITNNTPTPLWSFIHSIWSALGHTVPPPTDRIIYTKRRALMLAFFNNYLSNGETTTTNVDKKKVLAYCTHRWYDIGKARRVLGYEPEVSLEEGVRRMVEWWRARGSDSDDDATTLALDERDAFDWEKAYEL